MFSPLATTIHDRFQIRGDRVALDLHLRVVNARLRVISPTSTHTLVPHHAARYVLRAHAELRQVLAPLLAVQVRVRDSLLVLRLSRVRRTHAHRQGTQNLLDFGHPMRVEKEGRVDREKERLLPALHDVAEGLATVLRVMRQ